MHGNDVNMLFCSCTTSGPKWFFVCFWFTLLISLKGNLGCSKLQTNGQTGGRVDGRMCVYGVD